MPLFAVVAALCMTLSPLMAETVPAPEEGTGWARTAPNQPEAETQMVAPRLPPPLVTLELSKTASVTTADFGEELSFSLTVENLGPVMAWAVLVEDPLPAQVSFFDSDCGAAFADGVLTWDVGNLPVDGSITCTVTVEVVATGTIINQASARASNSALFPGDEVRATAIVQGPSALQVPALGHVSRGLFALLLGCIGWLAARSWRA